MFEQVKSILINQYNVELERFEELRKKIEELEEQMQDDHSEEQYQNDLKKLNKKYGLFHNQKKEYKKELNVSIQAKIINLLNELQENYFKQLKDFETLHENYIELRNEASKIDIYGIQKKLDQAKLARGLADLRLTEEEAEEIVKNGVN